MKSENDDDSKDKASANPKVTINNISIDIVPNSVTYTEGLGEQNMGAASTGGGAVEQVYSEKVNFWEKICGISGFSKSRHNPIEFIKSYFDDAYIGHITYDPKMKVSDSQYCRIEQITTDGTLMFTQEMIANSLIPLLQGTTCYKKSMPENPDKVKGIKYIIGDIRHSVVFGTVDLPCGRYPGVKERVRIPVICEYIY